MARIPPNQKATPIPVVPRTLVITNPDGTVTRSGQLLLEQVQATTTGTGGGDGTTDVTGPVTGFSFVGEVGKRYADTKDRLVHLTVGFTPIMPVPQTVTYLISPDDGAHWTWIGSQRMTSEDQILQVDRLAPNQDSHWRVAAVAGNLGGDPAPILDKDLDGLYPGVIRSNWFFVAGLATPPGSLGITATIGSQSDMVAADGFTHYGVIPAMTYTDPVNSTDYFVRVTVQDYDSTPAPIGPEKPYGGTQITGGSHSIEPLLITYIPGLAYIRYRIYTANRNSQGTMDFQDPATNTLQQVTYNGAPATADHYDVPITIPPFTGPDPGGAFNVLSVTASEVGPKYQDEKQGLHTTVGVIPVIDADYSTPRTVTIWFDFGTGLIVWQGWYALTMEGQIVRIGDATLGTDGTRKSGDIWVPVNTANGNWKVWCGAGRIDKGVDPSPYATYAFVVQPAGACLPNGTTNAHFIPDPDTGDVIVYSKWDPGIWYWEYHALEWTPPRLVDDPNYWFTMITVQKGATIGGVWTPAPDREGANDDKSGQWIGRDHGQVTQLPGVAGDQTATITKYGAWPATWVIPPAENNDGTPNPYREFRFLLYNVSRLGTDTSGSGGVGTYTLQTSCWPGGADHFILIPQPQAPSLDLRATNPVASFDPDSFFSGGNGAKIGANIQAPLDTFGDAVKSLGLHPIDQNWLADGAVTAQKTQLAAIDAAKGTLKADSVVCGLVNLPVSQLVYGSAIFTDTVYLSRGGGYPAVALRNDGIWLFGAANAAVGGAPAPCQPPANSVTPLLSQPWTNITNSNIVLYGGDTGGPNAGTGPSTQVNGGGVILYMHNGDLKSSHMALQSTGLELYAPKTFLMSLTGAQMQLKYDNGGIRSDDPVTPVPNPRVTFTNTMDASGLKLLYQMTPLPAPPNDLVPSFVLTSTYMQQWTKDGDSRYACIGYQGNQISMAYGDQNAPISASTRGAWTVQIGGAPAIMQLQYTYPTQGLLSLLRLTTSGLTIQQQQNDSTGNLPAANNGSAQVQLLSNGMTMTQTPVSGNTCSVSIGSGQATVNVNGTTTYMQGKYLTTGQLTAQEDCHICSVSGICTIGTPSSSPSVNMYSDIVTTPKAATGEFVSIQINGQARRLQLFSV